MHQTDVQGSTHSQIWCVIQAFDKRGREEPQRTSGFPVPQPVYEPSSSQIKSDMLTT